MLREKHMSRNQVVLDTGTLAGEVMLREKHMSRNKVRHHWKFERHVMLREKHMSRNSEIPDDAEIELQLCYARSIWVETVITVLNSAYSPLCYARSIWVETDTTAYSSITSPLCYARSIWVETGMSHAFIKRRPVMLREKHMSRNPAAAVYVHAVSGYATREAYE